jgi:hypothetical protein
VRTHDAPAIDQRAIRAAQIFYHNLIASAHNSGVVA